MKSTAIPTSGGVTLSLRTRARASSSAASVERSVEHFAARVLATGDPSAADSAAADATWSNSGSSKSVGDDRQRGDETLAGGRDFAHPTPKLSEQQPVTRLGCLLQRTLVACVAGEQHRHHVEVGRQLVAEIDSSLVGLGDGRRMDQQRCHDGCDDRDADRNEDPETDDPDRVEHCRGRATAAIRPAIAATTR